MTAMLPVISERNNIGLLRLLFATIVVCAHAAALSNHAAFSVFARYANAELAVQGFFVLSGFLVVMSYEKSRSLKDYAAKRLRRIYPAYASVIMICALAGAVLTTLPLQVYFGNAWVKYVAANLAFVNFVQPNLPGVFETNPLQAVNGALWTIKVEVCFYAVVPLLVWLFRTRYRLAWMAVFYGVSFVYAWGCTHFAMTTGHGYFTELGRQLPGQLAYFITGAALYYYHPWMLRNRMLLALGAIAVCALGVGVLYPAALGVLVMAVAFGPYLGNAEKFGDLSYGLYIWHFPLLQLFIALGLFAVHPWLGFAGAFLSALLAAGLSWHMIEKRFLRKSSHYLQAT